MAATIGGLTPDNYEKYRAQRLYDESRGNYQAVNQLNYIGGYQFGAQALETLGYLKPGTYKAYGNAAVDNPANWTNKGGIASKQDFLYNTKEQDKAYEGLTNQNAYVLEKYKTPDGTYRLTSESSQEERAGWLGAASLKGAGAMVKNGLADKPDANGTTPASVYAKSAGAVSGAVVTPPLPGGGSNTSQIPSSSGPPDRGTDIADADIAYFPSAVTLDANNTSGEERINLPIANPLEQFTSFNCLFTLSSLTADAVNFPDESYRKGIVGRIICSSGGRYASSRVSTAYQTDDNPAGKFDYFIDNLEMLNTITPLSSTKGTSVVTADFEVTEPYSMGQFLQSCQIAAVSNGHTDYTQSPFLLTLEFRGYTSDNEVVTVATRYFPIRMYSIDMTVTAAGCKYQVKTQAWNELALNDNYNFLKSDIAISGLTVSKILQSEETSLEHLVNSRLIELSKQDKSKAAYLPDQIAIVFPDVVKEIGPADQSDAADSATSSLQEGSAGGGNVESRVKLSRNKANILVQDEADISELGKAGFSFDQTRGGFDPKKPDQPIEVQALGNKKFARNAYQIDTKKREFIFKKGTSIINAITEIMLMSDYCTGAVTQKPDSMGFYKWFRIETQAYILPPNEQNVNTGIHPKLLVFRVVPYKIHQSLFATPNITAKGYQQLANECVKEYNYIYTGKNVDVLDFKLAMNNNFGTPMLAAGLGAAAGEALMARLGQSGAAQDTLRPFVQSADAPADGKGGGDYGTGYAIGLAKTDRWKSSDGAGDADNYKTLVAKHFMSRILNSDTEKVAADLTILGDPYFIADGGVGNWTNTNSTSRLNITATGAMDYQSSEVDILFNFRTPVDLNSSGSLTFAKSIDTQLEVPFSGLYKVISVKSSFSRGKFIQVLQLMRRPNQNPPGLPAYKAPAPDAEDNKPTKEAGGAIVNPNDPDSVDNLDLSFTPAEGEDAIDYAANNEALGDWPG